MNAGAGKTSRGFDIIQFEDANQCVCSIQQSSGIRCLPSGEIPTPGSSLLWLGCNEAKPRILASQASQYGVKTDETTGWIPYPVPEEAIYNTRMHLDRPTVSMLVQVMTRWLETGSLRIETQESIR